MNVVVSLTPKGKEALEKLRGAPAKMIRGLSRGLDAALEEAHQQTLRTRFSGAGPFPAAERRLGVRSGRLRSSFQRSPARPIGDSIVASIGSKVKYWPIHELGGQTKPHEIRPKNGKALRFMGRDGKFIFRRSVKHPGSRMPARAPMITGLQERAERMGKVVSYMLQQEVDKA